MRCTMWPHHYLLLLDRGSAEAWSGNVYLVDILGRLCTCLNDFHILDVWLDSLDCKTTWIQFKWAESTQCRTGKRRGTHSTTKWITIEGLGPQHFFPLCTYIQMTICLSEAQMEHSLFIETI